MDNEHTFEHERSVAIMEEELAVVAGVRNAADGRLVESTARILTEELWKGAGIHTPIQWLMWQTGVSRATARRVLTVALRAEELPTVMGLLAEGRLSLDQAHAVARYTPAEYEKSVCNLALYATVPQIIRATRTYGFDLEAPNPSPRERRGVSYGHDDDGTWWARIRLAAEEGALVEAALRKERDRLHEEAREAAKRAAGSEGRPDTGTDAELRVERTTSADALVSLAMGALAGLLRDTDDATDDDSDTGPDTDNAADGPTTPDRSGTGSAAGRVTPRGIRPKVHIHLERPTGDYASGPWIAEMHGGLSLPDWLRRQLTCDSDISVVWNRDGVPLSTCSSVRTPPDRLRRLIERRDHYTCRVPGCDNRRWLHLHHIIHWEDGGATITSNLAALCPDHHRAHHRGLLDITGNADAPIDSPDALRFKNQFGVELRSGSSVRPPTLEDFPDVGPYRHPTGEHLIPDAVYFNRSGPAPTARAGS